MKDSRLYSGRKESFPLTSSAFRYHIPPRSQFAIGAELTRQSLAMRLQSGEKLRLAFRSRHQAGQLVSIAGRKIPGVIFAKQADIARNARRYYRRSRDYSFRDYIRPAFQAGGMDSQMAAHQDLSNAPLRLLADPVITWIDLDLAAGAFGHLSVRRATRVDDLDA